MGCHFRLKRSHGKNATMSMDDATAKAGSTRDSIAHLFAEQIYLTKYFDVDLKDESTGGPKREAHSKLTAATNEETDLTDGEIAINSTATKDSDTDPLLDAPNDLAKAKQDDSSEQSGARSYLPPICCTHIQPNVCCCIGSENWKKLQD